VFGNLTLAKRGTGNTAKERVEKKWGHRQRVNLKEEVAYLPKRGTLEF